MGRSVTSWIVATGVGLAIASRSLASLLPKSLHSTLNSQLSTTRVHHPSPNTHHRPGHSTFNFQLSTLICLALLAAPAHSTTWLWQADNHKDNVSFFTDGKTSFTMTTEGGGQWFWDDPGPSAISYRNLTGWQRAGEGAGKKGRGFGKSSDFGEALNIDKGITIAARVRPISAFSEGTILLSVSNSSTADLPGGSTQLWVGWDVPDVVWLTHSEKMVRESDRSFDSSVKFEDRWCIWTLGAKQIGNTVAWDVWIDGKQQGADQRAPDGTLHTLVFTVKSSKGTAVQIGQRGLSLLPHDTVWDYVAITNDGVIPGWTGNAEAAKDPELKPLPQWRQDMLTKSAIHKCERLMKAGRWEEAIKTGEDIVGGHRAVDTAWSTELQEFRVIALQGAGRLDEAVEAARLLAAANLPADRRATWARWIGSVYRSGNKYRDAARFYLQATRLDPSREGQAEARYDLAICYHEIGYHVLARQYMAGVVRRHPGSIWAQRARGHLHVWDTQGGNPR